MLRSKIALIAATLVLSVACRSGGDVPPPSAPVPPAVRLVPQLPCLMARPVLAGAAAMGIRLCEAVGEGLCEPLTGEQNAALFAYIEAIEDYAWRAWRQCGRDGPRDGERSVGGRSGGAGAGGGAAP